MISDYEKVLSWLEDEESKFIYQKRVEYKETHNFQAIQKIVDRYVPELRDKPYGSGEPEKLLEEFIAQLRQKDRIVVFGAGVLGKEVLGLLKERGIAVAAVIDNHPEVYKNKLEVNGSGGGGGYSPSSGISTPRRVLCHFAPGRQRCHL